MAVDTTARILTVRDAIVTMINTDGGSFSGVVTGASNAAPIVITGGTHGLADGQDVTIAAVVGNTAANGTYTVKVISGTTFALVGTTGNGAYVSGGTWAVSRYVAKASYLPEYRLTALNVLQVDVRIVDVSPDALAREPSSKVVHQFEITVQKACGQDDIPKLDALVNIACRIARLFLPNAEIGSLSPVVVVDPEQPPTHEVYDPFLLREEGVFFSKIPLACREFANN